MENISHKFTVTPDGNMTYHGDKPVNVSMIFNPGDSLVRADNRKSEKDQPMKNLNSLRQLISLAMSKGERTVTISTEMASMIVVEYEKHRIAVNDAVDEIEECRLATERLNADKQRLISVVDEIVAIIDTDAVNELTEKEAMKCRELMKAYWTARGDL